MGHRVTAIGRCRRIMITTAHTCSIRIRHGTVLHIVTTMRGFLGHLHIAVRSLEGLRCEEYKYGQENVFHCNMIHAGALLSYFLSAEGVLRAGIPYSESFCAFFAVFLSMLIISR